MKLRVIGSIMKMSKKLHIYCFGHYLQGSGSMLDLSDKMNFDNITLMSRDTIVDEYGIAALYDKDVEGTKDTIYNTWGKAVIMGTEDLGLYWNNATPVKAIMDIYQFYPWCGSSTHFNNCSCEERSWGTVSINKSIKINIFPTEDRETKGKLVIIIDEDKKGWLFLFHNLHNGYEWKHEKKIRLKILDGKILRNTDILKIKYAKGGRYKIFTIIISDFIWSKLGKPFHYYAIRR